MSPTATAGPKTLVVFSDGTGNSAAKLQKTNVWRLYRALDLAAPTAQQAAAGDAAQIALYDDGVGTSEFRPRALQSNSSACGTASRRTTCRWRK